MWTYEQKYGKLSRNGTYIGIGYSGAGEGKNNPDMQDVHDVGPIPRGQYTMVTIMDESENPVDYEHKKAPVIHLVPDKANEMFGRDGFLIHGDSIAEPGTASKGCIIQAHPVREQIHQSPDKRLEVI